MREVSNSGILRLVFINTTIIFYIKVFLYYFLFNIFVLFFLVILIKLREKLTRVDDAIDENFAWYQTIVVLVHFAEQIRQS